VVATSNDGATSTAPASLTVVLEPAFYQTRTFFAACLACVFAAGWGWHRRRLAIQRQAFAMVLNERTRIAREIHDTIMQGVSGLSAQLEAISGMVSGAPPAAQRHLERVREQARAIIDEARRSIWDLRPGSLDRTTLVAAVDTVARTVVENQPVRLEVNADGEFVPMSDKAERSLLRIVQEAVSNAVEHGRATRIAVDVTFRDGRIHLRVHDDGCGFDPASAPADGHFGLMGMRERSVELGARFDITSAPGRGTTVKVSVPVRVPARAGTSA
jgi:signal transduction histidine kinase